MCRRVLCGQGNHHCFSLVNKQCDDDIRSSAAFFLFSFLKTKRELFFFFILTFIKLLNSDCLDGWENTLRGKYD